MITLYALTGSPPLRTSAAIVFKRSSKTLVGVLAVTSEPIVYKIRVHDNIIENFGKRMFRHFM